MEYPVDATTMNRKFTLHGNDVAASSGQVCIRKKYQGAIQA